MDDTCDRIKDISFRRILVIKLSSLGDIVHTLPAVAALRQQFTSAQICWLVKSEWASILEGNPDADEVWSVDLSWRNWTKLIKDLRRRQYDLVVDFQGLFRTGVLGLLSGANKRVGFSQAREGAAWMYTHRVTLPGDRESSWRLLRMHAIDRNLELAGFLGADVSSPVFHLPGLADDENWIQDLLSGEDVKEHTRLIALAPWSRSVLKTWPLKRFVELAEALVQIPTVRVVLLGGLADAPSAEAFRPFRAARAGGCGWEDPASEIAGIVE